MGIFNFSNNNKEAEEKPLPEPTRPNIINLVVAAQSNGAPTTASLFVSDKSKEGQSTTLQQRKYLSAQGINIDPGVVETIDKVHKVFMDHNKMKLIDHDKMKLIDVFLYAFDKENVSVISDNRIAQSNLPKKQTSKGTETSI